MITTRIWCDGSPALVAFRIVASRLKAAGSCEDPVFSSNYALVYMMSLEHNYSIWFLFDLGVLVCFTPRRWIWHCTKTNRWNRLVINLPWACFSLVLQWYDGSPALVAFRIVGFHLKAAGSCEELVFSDYALVYMMSIDHNYSSWVCWYGSLLA